MVTWVNCSTSNNFFRFLLAEELVGFATVDHALRMLAGAADPANTGYLPGGQWNDYRGWLRYRARPDEEYLIILRQEPRGPDPSAVLRRMAAVVRRRGADKWGASTYVSWDATTAVPYDSLDMSGEGFVALVGALTVLDAVTTL